MRDHLICILRDARTIGIGTDCTRINELAIAVETEAMAALHGGVTIIPSKLFGDIDIPKNVIIDMSNGADDLWLDHGCALAINIFYVPDGWHWGIYPINHEGTNTDNLIEKGKL